MYKVFGSGDDSSHRYKFSDDDFTACLLYVMHVINYEKGGLEYRIDYKVERFDENHNPMKTILEFVNPNQYRIRFVITKI